MVEGAEGRQGAHGTTGDCRPRDAAPSPLQPVSLEGGYSVSRFP